MSVRMRVKIVIKFFFFIYIQTRCVLQVIDRSNEHRIHDNEDDDNSDYNDNGCGGRYLITSLIGLLLKMNETK